MFGSSFKIMTVFGIPIKLDMTLVFLFIWVTNSLYRDLGITVAILAVFGLLVSIVLHELGHSVVAIQFGCRIREIVLMFMGGAAVMERVPRKPYQEFLMAIAGPAVSFACIPAFIYSGKFLYHNNFGSELLAELAVSLYLVGKWNIMLGIFNLLPAFPMDGGRIFRAMLTPNFGRLRATKYASNLGKFMAVLFIVIGINPHFIPYFSDADGYMWSLIIIGIFIFISAGNEYRMVVYEETMRNNPFSPFFESIQQDQPDTPEQPDVTEKKEGRTSADDDKVTISPPPYRKGEEDKTDISYDRKNPFDDLFKRKR